MATKSKKIDMLEGSITKNLILFAIPTVISGIANTLYGMADTAVLGIFGGREAMAGVGSTTTLYAMVLALFMGFASGVGIVVGRAIGQKNGKKVREAVHTSMICCILFGIVTAAIGIAFTEPLLRSTDVPENIMFEAKTYMTIIFLGAPVSLAYTCASRILGANGNVKRPMMITIASGALNVILNVVFVAGFNMTALGVAIATLMSSTFSLILGIICLMRENGDIRLSFRDLKISKHSFLELSRTGFPMGFQSFIFTFAGVIVQSAINGFGDAAIAGSSSGSSVGYLFYMAVSAVAGASTAFISQNYGAKKYDRVLKVVKNSVLIILALGGIEAVLIVFFGRFLVSLYTPGDTLTISYAYIRLLWFGGFCGLNGLAEIMTGATRAIGKSISPTVISIIGVCGVRVLWVRTAFVAMHKVFGDGLVSYGSVLVCFPISWIVTLVATAIVFFTAFKKLRKPEQDNATA